MPTDFHIMYLALLKYGCGIRVSEAEKNIYTLIISGKKEDVMKAILRPEKE